MKKDYLERQGYPTDLTDEQWVAIEPLFGGMREYKHISAAFYGTQLLSPRTLVRSLGFNP